MLHSIQEIPQKPVQLFKDCPDLMSVELFSKCLGVSKQVGWKMCREELVPNVKIGKRVFVPRDLLSDFVLEQVSD